MEVALRMFGAFQLLLYYLTLPLYFLWRWYSPRKKVPSITDDLLMMSATTLAEKIRSQQVSSEQVVQAYISRVEEVDGVIHAVTEQRFQAALAEAIAVDRLVASGTRSLEQLRRDTPLLGVPLTVKESCSLQGHSPISSLSSYYIILYCI
ncbi:hypothetical protein PR048_006553 [Dryococelus australis]|uniref:Amidase domain-containing protein n=1 Tax=Dryococelus australis TaxID=614101 RepID=A0ABQ9IBB6_9NEOP|nr:hypothetical protein PR048_006553 [Dryococelus australis]